MEYRTGHATGCAIKDDRPLVAHGGGSVQIGVNPVEAAGF